MPFNIFSNEHLTETVSSEIEQLKEFIQNNTKGRLTGNASLEEELYDAQVNSLKHASDIIATIDSVAMPWKRYLMACANREDTDQTAHLCSLIRVLPICINSPWICLVQSKN